MDLIVIAVVVVVAAVVFGSASELPCSSHKNKPIDRSHFDAVGCTPEQPDGARGFTYCVLESLACALAFLQFLCALERATACACGALILAKQSERPSNQARTTSALCCGWPLKYESIELVE